MKKYSKPAVKRIVMGRDICDGDMPELSLFNEQGEEGGFADEYDLFEEENEAYYRNIRNLNVWEK